MSNEKFSAFMAAVQNDSELQKEFAAVKSPGALLRFTEKLGYSFSRDEIGEEAKKLGFDLLSDDDLKNISGGQSMMGPNKPTAHAWYSGD